MSFPCALTLHTTPDGPRLFRWPVREISKLYTSQIRLHDIALAPGADHPVPAFSGDLWDVEAEFAPDFKCHCVRPACQGRGYPLPCS